MSSQRWGQLAYGRRSPSPLDVPYTRRRSPPVENSSWQRREFVDRTRTEQHHDIYERTVRQEEETQIAYRRVVYSRDRSESPDRDHQTPSVYSQSAQREYRQSSSQDYRHHFREKEVHSRDYYDERNSDRLSPANDYEDTNYHPHSSYHDEGHRNRDSRSGDNYHGDERVSTSYRNKDRSRGHQSPSDEYQDDRYGHRSSHSKYYRDEEQDTRLSPLGHYERADQRSRSSSLHDEKRQVYEALTTHDRVDERRSRQPSPDRYHRERGDHQSRSSYEERGQRCRSTSSDRSYEEHRMTPDLRTRHVNEEVNVCSDRPLIAEPELLALVSSTGLEQLDNVLRAKMLELLLREHSLLPDQVSLTVPSTSRSPELVISHDVQSPKPETLPIQFREWRTSSPLCEDLESESSRNPSSQKSSKSRLEKYFAKKSDKSPASHAVDSQTAQLANDRQVATAAAWQLQPQPPGWQQPAATNAWQVPGWQPNQFYGQQPGWQQYPAAAGVSAYGAIPGWQPLPQVSGVYPHGWPQQTMPVMPPGQMLGWQPEMPTYPLPPPVNAKQAKNKRSRGNRMHPRITTLISIETSQTATVAPVKREVDSSPKDEVPRKKQVMELSYARNAPVAQVQPELRQDVAKSEVSTEGLLQHSFDAADAPSEQHYRDKLAAMTVLCQSEIECEQELIRTKICPQLSLRRIQLEWDKKCLLFAAAVGRNFIDAWKEFFDARKKYSRLAHTLTRAATKRKGNPPEPVFQYWRIQKSARLAIQEVEALQPQNNVAGKRQRCTDITSNPTVEALRESHAGKLNLTAEMCQREIDCEQEILKSWICPPISRQRIKSELNQKFELFRVATLSNRPQAWNDFFTARRKVRNVTHKEIIVFAQREKSEAGKWVPLPKLLLEYKKQDQLVNKSVAELTALKNQVLYQIYYRR